MRTLAIGNIRRYLTVALGLVLTALIAGLAHAQPAPSTNRNTAEFTCKIRVLPRTVSACEPLRVDIRFEYLGDKPKGAYLPVSPTEIVFFLGGQPVEGFMFFTDAWPDELPPLFAMIPAKAKSFLTARLLFNFHTREFITAKPGPLTVRAQYQIPLADEKGYPVPTFTVSDEAEVQGRA